MKGKIRKRGRKRRCCLAHFLGETEQAVVLSNVCAEELGGARCGRRAVRKRCRIGMDNRADNSVQDEDERS